MTNKNERSGGVPQWMVERLAADDLPAKRAVDVRRRLESEADGPARLEQIVASNAEILAAHPADLVAAQIRARMAKAASAPITASSPRVLPSGRRHWTWVWGTPTLALATLAIALWLRPDQVRRPTASETAPGATHVEDGDGNGDGDRIKGLRPNLLVYRKVGGRIERLAPGAVAHAGDQLQLAYVAAGHRFGAVLSVDGAGHVTFHLPAGGGRAARLRTDGEVALTEAYELDAAPGFEQFVFVSGNTAFDTSSLVDVVRGTAAAPAGTLSIPFTVRKE
ncbi:MAG: ActD-like protein [Deltaproteobacteria bacterium]|nr:ActD-like protein [Deltaproteobacteria bacterium]